MALANAPVIPSSSPRSYDLHLLLLVILGNRGLSTNAVYSHVCTVYPRQYTHHGIIRNALSASSVRAPDISHSRWERRRSPVMPATLPIPFEPRDGPVAEWRLPVCGPEALPSRLEFRGTGWSIWAPPPRKLGPQNSSLGSTTLNVASLDNSASLVAETQGLPADHCRATFRLSTWRRDLDIPVDNGQWTCGAVGTAPTPRDREHDSNGQARTVLSQR